MHRGPGQSTPTGRRSSSRSGWVPVLILLLTVGATPSAALEPIDDAPAKWWSDAPTHETRAVVLLHHPFDYLDPFGVPFPSVPPPGANAAPGTVADSFSYRYAPLAAQSTLASGAFPFPTFVADGIEPVFSIPDGGEPYQSTLANYTQTLHRRLATEPPVAVAVRARPVMGNIIVDAAAWPRDPAGLDAGASDLHLWVALVEDGIHYEPPQSVANGITDHRFTVRAIADLGSLRAINATQGMWIAAPGEDWNMDRISAAAWVQAATPGRFAAREVLQAASAPLGGSSTQISKAGLVELYSATWCSPCLYGDLAAERIAILYGNATELEARHAAGYYQAPGPYEGPGAAVPDVLGALIARWDAHTIMDFVLLLGAAAAFGGATAAGREAIAVRRGRTRAGASGKWLATTEIGWMAGAAFAASAAFLFLVWRFLTVDLSYENVFLYSSVDLEWQWRLAGAWSSREGSLLLWTAILAAVAFVVARQHSRSHQARVPDDADPALLQGQAWTRLILALTTGLFLLASLHDSPFGRTSDNLLQGRPLGNGLNPTLKSGFILIHPPLMFLAYAITTVPAAAALGHLASGTDRWSRIAMQWSRAGWLVMTFAIGLGAMWAYYTLGFGGYFAWDPVEVANLLPWLALTLYLHVQLHHARHGTYERIGPALAILPLLFTLFSAISTRSGLWVSVHAFTDPTDSFNPDAAARMLRILDVEPSLAFYVGLFLAIVALMLGLWTHRASHDLHHLRKVAHAFAFLFAAVALAALFAPTYTMAALLHVGWLVTGSAGYGLLALAFAAVVLAAVPVLFAPGPATGTSPAAKLAHESLSLPGLRMVRLRRALRRLGGPWTWLNLRTLNAYAAAALGLALLVLFLFHMAAVNGWSTAFYETRFPYLAAPILLGLFVLQTHGTYGKGRSLAGAAGLAGLALVARVAWPGSSGAMLGVLAIGATVAGLDRVRRAARPKGLTDRAHLADVLLWFAAMLDVLFWAAPPTVRLGFTAYNVSVFTGVMLAASAVMLLWLATWALAGGPMTRMQRTLVAVAIGTLGGFYVATILAAVAWWLRRRDARNEPLAANLTALRARLKQAGLYGLHLAIALAVTGYAMSTYAKSGADAEIGPGETMRVGGLDVRYDAMPASGQVAGAFVDVIEPQFTLLDGGTAIGSLQGSMEWEQRAGAHYPTPSVVHLATGDVYLDVEAVHVTKGAACAAGGAKTGWIEAYRVGTPGRACVGDTFDMVRVKAVHLPGISLLWLAMLLFVVNMGLVILMSDDGRRGANRQQGFSAATAPGTQ